MTIALQYERELNNYKRKWKEIRDLQKKGRTSNKLIHHLDIERNKIHRELRRLAVQIEKTSQDVDLDILINEKSLAEYGLNEFYIENKSTINTSDPALFSVLEYYVFEDNKRRIATKVEIDEMEVIIPFGIEEGWHLFDHDLFTTRLPDNTERRRRAKKVSEGHIEGVKYCEIYDSETFHRGKNFFGIAFPQKMLHKVLLFMREHRNDISIEKDRFDENILISDFREIVKEDIEFILEYEPGEQESHEYLLERYRRTLQNHYLKGKKMEQYVDFLNKEVFKVLEIIKEEGIKREIDRELDIEEQIEREYPISQEVSKEGFGKRQR
jgi:hypothetical protein